MTPLPSSSSSSAEDPHPHSAPLEDTQQQTGERSVRQTDDWSDRQVSSQTDTCLTFHVDGDGRQLCVCLSVFLSVSLLSQRLTQQQPEGQQTQQLQQQQQQQH